MLEEQSYDESVDWWALGVMLYRLLTAKVCIFLSFYRFQLFSACM